MRNTIRFAAFVLSLTLLSCGGGEHNATDTGSASFGLKFEEASATAMKLAPSMAPADICSSYGIDTISGTVYNSSNAVIASGGPWACSSHTGTIYNIPTGSNIRIAIKGTVSGTVVWQGETTGATIYAGQDTNVGSISMTYTGNDATRPTVSAATPTGTTVPLTSPITVTFSEAMAASTIVATTFTLKNGAVAVSGSVTYNATTKTATFTPTSSLSNSVIYTATVTTDVTDMAANKMQSLYTWDFTTEAPPGSAPTTPTGVTATAADKQVTVSWTAVSGATSYNIYWSTSTGVTKTNGTLITGATSPYIHTALTNGTTYYYVVTAANSYGESAASSQASAMPLPPVTTAPTGISATAGNTQATISWSAVTGATSYNLYWATTTGVTTANGTKITGATSPYTHTGRTNGTTYYYIVTAVNLGGESTASSQVSVMPSLLMGGSIQGTPLNLTSTNATVTTFAGSAGLAGSTDGTGTAARLNRPFGITTDGTNLFVTDSVNNTIRKIVISSGAVTTIAGSSGLSGSTDGTGSAARFNAPICITTDGTNLFVADYNSHTIRKIVISTGAVTTFAGSAGLTGSTDGTGSAARFNLPHDITTDGANLFVADYGNHTIRKIVIATGAVTTIAGSASVSGLTDGIGTAARFNGPVGITTDGTNLFVTDYWNNTIRKMAISTGVVTTIAGSAGVTGSTDGTGTAARFFQPNGITTDGTNLFVTDYWNHTIRKVVISTGVVTTIAGSAGVTGSTDGTGASARFNNPGYMTTDGTNLFVTDTTNDTIRKIQPTVLIGGAVQGAPLNLTNTVTTIAGAALSTGSTDGTGTAARFNRPYGITTPDGINLYIADANNSTIRKMVISTGQVSTIAGSAGVTGSTDGTGTAARFNGPTGISTDGTNLFVTDSNNYTIRKMVISTGAVTTIAGSPGLYGSTDGTGSAARFYNSYDLTTDGTNLYVADTSNHAIRRIVISTGAVTTLAGGVAAGTADGIGSAARFFYPYSLTTDGTNLYVTDSGNSTIRKIIMSTGVVTTMAGSAGITGSTDGTGTAARFFWPRGITTDGGNLYVSDTDNATIRKIVISTAAVTTISGFAGSVGSTDGTGSAARFNWPAGINTDGTSLFVADDNNHTIRKIQ